MTIKRPLFSILLVLGFISSNALVSRVAPGQEAQEAAARPTRVPSLVEGVIKEARPLAEGQLVEAGEVLVVIDPVDYEVGLTDAKARLASVEAEVMIAEASLKIAMENFELAKANVEAGAITENELRKREFVFRSSEGELRKARAALVAARAGADLRELMLSRCSIKAPRNGKIVATHFKVGEFVTRGQVVVEIEDGE